MGIEERLATFDPMTVEKVQRLFDLVDGFNKHPDLRGKFAMHGGTPINLLLLDMPRLSVDIDMCYIASASREEMLEDKPTVEQAIQEMAAERGFVADPRRGDHAGRTFILNYQYGPLTDHVKIDVNYLHRSPLMPTVQRTSPIRPEVVVTTFSDEELIGGKVCAYLERVVLRDLFDLHSIGQFLGAKDGEYLALVHKVALYYYSISNLFPRSPIGRSRRFEGLASQIDFQLTPVIDQELEIDVASLCKEAEAFTSEFVMPRSHRDEDYLANFSEGDFQPALLFDDPSMAAHASEDPVALWKLDNLRRALESGQPID